MFRSLTKPFFGAALLMVVAGSALARPELNAFINRPANTIPELIAQMKSDPVVMDRFMRHFGMTRSEVLNYVRSLRLGTIKVGGNYTVYSVPENGSIKVHTSYFKAGTAAFVDAAGNPILRIKCGNPFVRGPRVAAVGSPLPVDTAALDLRPVVEPQAIAPAPEYTAVIPPPEIETVPLEANVPVPTAPVEPAGPASPQILAPVVGILAGLGAAASFTNGGGNNPQPVPEPASMLALGGAAVALVARRNRR